ncbi:hypothetical protein [Myxosarcina sp. GI1]|uniref:hypothetical protein n=1 Tax=Myxosarcina sp. GI1 TaxID=1541065 RepID=UPI00056C7D71|nr:hypothetical protein [Myxosarcina sp. GI1]
MRHSTSKQKQKIALNLLHLLFINKLRYNEKWECWTGYIVKSEDKWGEIPYKQLLDIAALIASGLTKQRASIEETKILLQQIERWVTQSNGKLVEVRESKRRTKWYPACLVEAAVDKELKIA